MDQRVSLITLGVANIDASAAFYDALGWQRVMTDDPVICYDLLGNCLGLYPRQMLADDMGLDVGALGTGGITLSINVPEKAGVAAALDQARRAGATILREASDIFWGGHIAYFKDPDGHVWEIAWNPHAPLGPDGAFRWNGYPP